MAAHDEKRDDSSTIVEPGSPSEGGGMLVETPMQDLEPVPGDIIDGKYQVLERLGSGATGVVLRCVDTSLQRQVAVKLIKRHRMSDEFLRGQFLSEARALARISHPNVVDIHTYGEHQDRPYLVMEYVEGTSLEEWLSTRVELPPFEESLRILDKICRGVEAIHASGRVHRDLKPGNVLIGPLRVAVADLGLAAAAGQTFFAGTPAYMAPEVALREPGHETPVTTAVDIFAIGVIAYQLLTGHLPRPRGQEAGAVDPVKPRTLRPELPSGIDAVVLRALSIEPRSRHASAASFRQELLQVWRVSGPHFRPIRVVIVDDDPDMAALVGEAVLSEFPGAIIDYASDGGAGFAAAVSKPTTLVITDYQMPEIDGLALTAMLREDPRTNTVPIIVVTGEGGAPEWRELNQLGADAFQVKPLDSVALRSTARRLIEARRRAPE